MNWGKALLAGVVGGIVVNIYNFVMHGMIMGSTYTEYAAFAQEEASPVWFFVVSIFIGIAGALLFAKSRGSWGDGVKGGVTFGLFIGLVSFFAQFYSPLVINDFPYFLSWCWGGISLIGWLIFGAIAGVMYKEPAAAA
ncbi:hypothetical protein GWN42_05760 [candidate division KSB1 bacterium]|nr:hypothetical protein [candidate division KSB1 bacterium]